MEIFNVIMQHSNALIRNVSEIHKLRDGNTKRLYDLRYKIVLKCNVSSTKNLLRRNV